MYRDTTYKNLDPSVDEDTISCGLCGITIYQPTPFGNLTLNPDISHAYGTAARAQVSLNIGEDSSDIHAGETSYYDICPKCFEEKLKPWFNGQGAKAKIKQWSS